MSDQPENLMLVYLRRLDAKMDALRDDMQDLKHRMTTVEIQVGQMVSSEMNHYASISSRLDRIENRLERLERHADVIPLSASSTPPTCSTSSPGLTRGPRAREAR